MGTLTAHTLHLRVPMKRTCRFVFPHSREILVFAALGFGAGCAADFESDSVVMCTSDRGCPVGSRCTEDRLCEMTGAQVFGPSVPTPIVVVGFPSPQLDAGFVSQVDGGFFVDVGIGFVDTQDVCAPGTTACGINCVDLITNRDNCGTCGFRCPFGTECTFGACVIEMPGTLPNPGI
jgi:hypothetical protein